MINFHKIYPDNDGYYDDFGNRYLILDNLQHNLLTNLINFIKMYR